MWWIIIIHCTMFSKLDFQLHNLTDAVIFSSGVPSIFNFFLGVIIYMNVFLNMTDRFKSNRLLVALGGERLGCCSAMNTPTSCAVGGTDGCCCDSWAWRHDDGLWKVARDKSMRLVHNQIVDCFVRMLVLLVVSIACPRQQQSIGTSLK